VFLLEPERTQFDLSWRMFGIHVRVHPMFWLVSAIFGWNILQINGIGPFLIFIVCMFVSVLVHELGHVFMGRIFGRDSHIVLYAFGGIAVGHSYLPGRWQRVAVSLAGPGAGFLLFGIMWLVLRYGLPHWDPSLSMPLLWSTVWWLYVINLFLNLLNLMPIWPLDGGQVSREIFTGLMPRNGVRTSLGVSLVLAGLLAIQALTAYWKTPTANGLIPFLGMVYGPYTALLFAMLAIQSFLLLQQVEDRPWREDWPSRWDRDR
jgi:Zn-dependent protease